MTYGARIIDLRDLPPSEAPWGWQSCPAGDDGAEILPLWDLDHHELGGDCPCGGRYDGEMIVHNAFDGREPFERGERKVS
jgi:hypothetical protein